MESWRKVWREGFVPQFNKLHLEVILKVLLEDDPKLLQGVTTVPPPLHCVQDWPVEACCVTAYAGWKGNELVTVAEVVEFFSHICYECDMLVGEPAGCRWFLNFYDEAPRDEMRRELLAEVELALAQKNCEELPV